MPHFFYILDFPQIKLSHIKIGVTNDLTRRIKEVERAYKGKAKIIYVESCETSQEMNDMEDISRVLLRSNPNFIFQPKDRFIYAHGERPLVPVPKTTAIECEICYI